MKKFLMGLILTLMTILVIVIIIGVIAFISYESHMPENEYYEEQYQSENSMNKSIEHISEEDELPDSLYFMRNFDYTKNDDDTYSFVGYITGHRNSEYSLAPTIYITTSNGESYSTGAAEDFNKMYIGRNGEISVILNDMLTGNEFNYGGIPFTFVYSSDGELVDIIPPEPYRYRH